ncbi:VOC family protein [Ruania zhangjianzhongii]|uniref:VOC family protein n=1 Tax=Ruania zhangjianzhongii TaxID=2603206 RepID=UPI0011C9EABF|nr:VOC family protein [Ruania zhangjianzhongii]
MSTPRPRIAWTSVTIMAPAPRELAAFYARLLDGEVTASEPPGAGDPEHAGWAQVRASGRTLNFEFEHCWSPPVWPAQHDRQISSQHLDLHVVDLAAATDWARECGAILAEVQPQEDVRVLFDPAGHPFCLFR